MCCAQLTAPMYIADSGRRSNPQQLERLHAVRVLGSPDPYQVMFDEVFCRQHAVRTIVERGQRCLQRGSCLMTGAALTSALRSSMIGNPCRHQGQPRADRCLAALLAR